MQYLGNMLEGEIYLSTEKLPLYSTPPADWAILWFCRNVEKQRNDKKKIKIFDSNYKQTQLLPGDHIYFYHLPWTFKEFYIYIYI